MVPVFGFGGKPKLPNFSFNQALHCFPLNGNPNNPEVYGLEGIMQSYLNMLLHVELAGPTLFNPIITEAVKVAAENKKNNIDVYTVLLILTGLIIIKYKLI